MVSLGNPQIVLFAAYLLAGFGAFTLMSALLQEQQARAAEENLADLANKKVSNPIVRLLRPILIHYVVPALRGKEFWNKLREMYRVKISSAGLRNEMTADEVIALKLVLVIFFPLTGFTLRSLDLIDISTFWILAFGVVGFFYPDLWLSGAAKSRQKQIRRAMPFVVDLLGLATEAGLDFVGAMGKVVEKAPSSPLIEELEQVLKEIRLGATRAEALRKMASQVNMIEIGSFVGVLIAQDQMGGSIGKVLKQQSESVRNQRFVAAEKAGAAAAQKILVPLIFFILPAVILMVFGPFALEFLTGK